ncbi:uncharacterized protein CDAR_180681 [Caerostris darwini]|uniref:Uncharacterized protein n=1 Tax=Caerostris darwini TaxID=1538125 RepID=A0AAV4PPK9_9ARAC|nr:uncharacterized protein CDAR_180681 [Caerostris darwini]
MKGTRWLQVIGFSFGLFGTIAATVAVLDDAKDFKSLDLYRSARGHLHLLGECRRQLTFLVSVALGAFITRVMKESPLTPLPLPPLPNSLHWNLISVPAHLGGHLIQWTQKHPAGQHVILNQGVAGLARSLPGGFQPKNLIRLRKRFAKEFRNSPNMIYSAVRHTLKPLKFIIPHAIGMRRWLLRWCH